MHPRTTAAPRRRPPPRAGTLVSTEKGEVVGILGAERRVRHARHRGGQAARGRASATRRGGRHGDIGSTQPRRAPKTSIFPTFGSSGRRAGWRPRALRPPAASSAPAARSAPSGVDRGGGGRVERAGEGGAIAAIQVERFDLEAETPRGRAEQLGWRRRRQPPHLSTSVQSPVLASPRAPRAAAPLPPRRERRPGLHELAGVRRRVVPRLLDAARVDDHGDVVDGERGLGDVGREHHLSHPARRRRKDPTLLARRQLAVQGKQHQRRALAARLSSDAFDGSPRVRGGRRARRRATAPRPPPPPRPPRRGWRGARRRDRPSRLRRELVEACRVRSLYDPASFSTAVARAAAASSVASPSFSSRAPSSASASAPRSSVLPRATYPDRSMASSRKKSSIGKVRPGIISVDVAFGPPK